MDTNYVPFFIFDHLDQVPWLIKFVCAYAFIWISLGFFGSILFGVNGNNFLEKCLELTLNSIILGLAVGIGVMNW